MSSQTITWSPLLSIWNMAVLAASPAVDANAYLPFSQAATHFSKASLVGFPYLV